MLSEFFSSWKTGQTFSNEKKKWFLHAFSTAIRKSRELSATRKREELINFVILGALNRMRAMKLVCRLQVIIQGVNVLIW